MKKLAIFSLLSLCSISTFAAPTYYIKDYGSRVLLDDDKSNDYSAINSSIGTPIIRFMYLYTDKDGNDYLSSVKPSDSNIPTEKVRVSYARLIAQPTTDSAQQKADDHSKFAEQSQFKDRLSSVSNTSNAPIKIADVNSNIIPIPQNKVQYNQLNNIIESYAEKDP